MAWIIYGIKALGFGGLCGTSGLAAILMAMQGQWAGCVALSVVAIAAYLSMPRRPNAWRSDRPTAKQLAYARDLGIRVARNATKGDVSDAITAVTGQ